MPRNPGSFTARSDKYELRDAGGGGRTFVRGVKDYVKHHSGRANRIPSEHVLVYDEAQRAYDADMVAAKHPDMREARSEPELFVEFAERVPEWCVVVGLIGGGQEIHTGEEGGTVQWADAIGASSRKQDWIVHGPAALRETFEDIPYSIDASLNLNQSLRSHLSFRVHEYVAHLVAPLPAPVEAQAGLAAEIAAEGHDLRICRDLELSKAYLRERYGENSNARFGVVASSRDRDLTQFGVLNDFQATKRLRYGPWYGDDETTPSRRSCCHLQDCVTEFGAQGLELDAVLLAWGTDFRREGAGWNIDRARRYLSHGPKVRDPWQLRANAYRVLLTRARDATVVFVPPLPELDATYEYLVGSGFRPLSRG